MSLPTKWVDAIFTRLSVVYGRDFLSRWEGVPIAAVKTDWGECLKGFAGQPESIAFALSNLPYSKPPTVLEFRAICRQAPVTNPIALPEPKADQAIVSEQLRKMAATTIRSSANPEQRGDPLAWAKRLKARHDKGEKLGHYQIFCYRKALGIEQRLAA